MSLVTLVSGGLDSTLMALLAQEEGITQYPLFINYGQLSAKREWRACQLLHERFGLPTPAYMDLSGFGRLVSSGLTDRHKRVNEDAFLPGRNLLFLLAAAAYACQVNANAIAIGLLSEDYHIFPDQTATFLSSTEALLLHAVGREIRVVAPLMRFSKGDVMELARARGIEGTYSCHAGGAKPCGHCVSCQEALNAHSWRRR